MGARDLNAVVAIQSFRPTVGGAELQLERLLPHLARQGVRAEVLTRAVPGVPRREQIPGAAVVRTPLAGESPWASIVYVAAALARIARRRRRIDLVHAHGALSPATIALGARALGLPCLVTVLGAGPHGDLARLARKPLGRTRSRVLARAAWFAALSAQVEDELRALGVPAERILALPNGVDLERFRPADADQRARLRSALGLAPDAFVAAFVGRLHPVKDVDTLLRATAAVPAMELVVAGDGPERARLETLARELAIAGRVRFVGMLASVADLLRAADAFLLSSHGEGMSNALLEAMACGLPCLASGSVGGARELLAGGRGTLVADGDAEAWARAIRRLIGEPGLGAQQGRAAAEHVARSLSLPAAADRLARAYDVVAGRRAPAILYLVSSFPKVTETFVVDEWLALGERHRMLLAALRRSGQAPVHPESRAALPRVTFARALSPAAHARWLARRPRAYLAALGEVARAGVRTSPIQAVKALAAFGKAVALASRAQREGVAHVHAHFANHPATAAWVVHRLTGIPFSFTAHANDLFVAPALLERKAADARFVVAISEHNRRLLHARCPGARVEVVHCGVDAQRLGVTPPRAGARVVCVAGLTPKKGHLDLVDAFAKLAERHPEATLDLVGDGPQRAAILARARERAVDRRVRLLGARPREGVREALAGAALFALACVRTRSGRMDGIPVALMEAMASGVPVVTTRLSGIPELVVDGETGLLVEPGDPDALAAAMGRVLDDPELAARLAAGARAHVERSFSLATQAQRLAALFAPSLNGGDDGRPAARRPDLAGRAT